MMRKTKDQRLQKRHARGSMTIVPEALLLCMFDGIQDIRTQFPRSPFQNGCTRSTEALQGRGWMGLIGSAGTRGRGMEWRGRGDINDHRSKASPQRFRNGATKLNTERNMKIQRRDTT